MTISPLWPSCGSQSGFISRCPACVVLYVPRYDDIVEVCRRADEFGQGGFEPLEADSRPPELIQLGESDPPEHTKVRPYSGRGAVPAADAGPTSR